MKQCCSIRKAGYKKIISGSVLLGNIRSIVIIILACITVFCQGCSDDFDRLIVEEVEAGGGVVPGGPDDTLAPVTGGSGLLTIADTRTDSITVEWVRASDNETVSAELLYKVIMSDNSDIANYAEIVENGIEYTTGWNLDIQTITLRGLEPDRTYYFNVLVSDRAGNVSAYVMNSAVTDEIPAIDTEPPVLVNDGELTIFQPQTNSVKIKWQKPSDNVTASDDLEYQIYYSLLPNIETYTDIMNNGTYASLLNGISYTVGEWIPGLNNELIGGLAPGTTYYFNVMVRDEYENIAVFTMEEGATE
jgi:hypothetical protein